jgi:ribonuclease T1
MSLRLRRVALLALLLATALACNSTGQVQSPSTRPTPGSSLSALPSSPQTPGAPSPGARPAPSLRVTPAPSAGVTPTASLPAYAPSARVTPTPGDGPTAPSDFRGSSISRARLPPEAIATLALIEAGGPFPYDQDGSVFQNREGLLPSRPRGYYREYTVQTPGSPDRGARRIVTGASGERYWTDDHYESFAFILE